MKSGSLSLQMVVVAAICLIVLVVLTFIFSGRMSLFNKGLRECDTVCVETASQCQEQGYSLPLLWSNCDDGERKFDENAYCCS